MATNMQVGPLTTLLLCVRVAKTRRNCADVKDYVTDQRLWYSRFGEYHTLNLIQEI